MKNVMSIAWTIAREGAAKFGGNVRQYFAESLRIAWAEIKAKATRTIMDMVPELESMGFKRWTKGNMDRMYINPYALGFVTEHYKTGNLSYAEICGYRVSNCEGRRIAASKTYIDLKTGKLHSDNYYTFEAACDLLGIEKPIDSYNVATVAAA